MTRLRADLLLLLCALIWGTTFVAQKEGNGAGPFAFVSGRFLMSALMLIPLAVWESGRRSKPVASKDRLLAGAIGLCLFSGSAIQQLALKTTSVTNAGFITSLYIAFVPFAGWLVFKIKVPKLVLAACALSLAGAWLLAGHGQAGQFERGDLLVLGSAVLYALHIVLISIFLKRCERPFFLCAVQNTLGALAGAILAGVFEPLRADGLEGALPSMVYAGVLSGGIAYTLQIVGQKHTPATEAALIMSTESVFAALAAAIVLGERLTPTGIAGCLMIMAGVVMVEVLPALPGGRRPAAPLGEVPFD